MKTIILGGEVVVSDPCYDIPTWCQAVIKNVKPGTYFVIAEQTNETHGRGQRCKNVVAIHVDDLKFGENIESYPWKPTDRFIIGVDSGQCGIFDLESFRNDAIADSIIINREIKSGDWNYEHTIGGDAWYDKMCQLTLMTIDGWDCYANGVNSSSGYGDGSYVLYTLEDKSSNIIGLMVEFIGENIEDEE